MSNKFISDEEWMPLDGMELENEALNVVRTDRNVLVTAGPGSGKTELLAQKACYLLQTNKCRYPRKILSLSYKKDAAANLRERVKERCGGSSAKRFVSITYDAFAKGLLDCFRCSLPKEYRPDAGYKITNTSDRKSCLTFSMISRLAEYIIRTNPYLKRAISLTYSHVFLDEFQDTTHAQYELVKTCFMNTSTHVTAVGDKKQRIMGWAGAMGTVFEDFCSDFGAEKRSLFINYRSAPKLVKLQKMMYILLEDDPKGISCPEGEDKEEGVIRLYKFCDELSEAETIANEIKELVSSGTELKDICIVSKQKPEEYTQNIMGQLEKLGIRARLEEQYQYLFNF